MTKPSISVPPSPACLPPDPRGTALAAAILFRNCAVRLRASNATRAACRKVMREQALKWRDLAPPESTSSARD
jgi:hypothetical protein